MRRIVACSGLVIAVAGGLQIPGLPVWGLALGLIVIGALAWRLSVCPHDGPLALLPATRDNDGTPLPPRWYCDACGATWAANFDKDQTPVRKFTGYDESKAVSAARRAAELADRQRALALQRAGLRPQHGPRHAPSQGVRQPSAAKKPKPAAQPVVHAPDTADVVPIGQGRRFAG
jgi:hypothetical protein